VKRFAAALFLLIAVVVLYRKTIRLWWTYDDPWLLHLALERPWTQAFQQGETWHRVSAPLLDSTYEVMLALAGLEPHRWYRVLLVLLALSAVSVFAALRLYLETLPALTGAFLFLAGAPACTFVTQLMLMHYLEAILFAALSVIAFAHASRRQSNLLNFVSAICYVAAMLAERAAVLLPLLLLVLPERELRVRARHLVVHVFALLAYSAWWVSTGGGIFGEVGWTLSAREIPLLVGTLPWRVIREWAGASIGVGMFAVALLGVGMALALRKRTAIVIALTGLLLVLAPIVLLSKDMQPRWAFIPWLWACSVFACGLATLRGASQKALAVAVAAAIVIANRQEWTDQFSRSERMSDEARAYMSLQSADMLRRPAVPPAAMSELRWLKEEYLHGHRGAGWYYDDLFLCGAALQEKRFYEYFPAKRAVVEVTARIPDYARAYCASIRENAPLRAEFRHRNEALFWRFGPYDDGKWRVVLAGGIQAFDVPREDGFKLPGVPGLSLRVRYQSPEGWVTYSPEINLEFARQPELEWHR
jgi:hypothetical protein